MTWDKRLPDGVRLVRKSKDGFSLTVDMPTDDDGLLPLVCPANPEHKFKAEIDPKPSGPAETPDDIWCPYCGHVATVHAFMADQQARFDAAAEAAIDQHVADTMAKAFGTRFKARPNIEVTIGKPPVRRSLPTYDIPETHRLMVCGRCSAKVAVYGIALYCAECGALAPAEQLVEIVRVQRGRLAAFDSIEPDRQRAFDHDGILTANYESTIKDGFTALETYLKQRFSNGAPAVTIHGNAFQRLDEAADLFQKHLDEDIKSEAGTTTWDDLKHVASIRHVLTHNNGIVDQRFLDQTGLPQLVGRFGFDHERLCRSQACGVV